MAFPASWVCNSRQNLAFMHFVTNQRRRNYFPRKAVDRERTKRVDFIPETGLVVKLHSIFLTCCDGDDMIMISDVQMSDE